MCLIHIPFGLDATSCQRSSNDRETNRIERIILFNVFLIDSTNPLDTFLCEVYIMHQALAEIAVQTECWPVPDFWTAGKLYFTSLLEK